MVLHTLILDKVELLQALDFQKDLKKINLSPIIKCIFTTTDPRDDIVKSV
jgi:hypothetical protein